MVAVTTPTRRLTRAPPHFNKWDLSSDRYGVWKNMEESRAAVWRWLVRGKGQKYARTFGIVLDADAPKTIYRNRSDLPTVEVHSVRTALRRDARGATVTDIVVEVTQRRRGYFEQADQDGCRLSATSIQE